MAGDGLEALPEMEQLEGNVAKDLFAGAVGGIAQVFVGESSRTRSHPCIREHKETLENYGMSCDGEKQEMYRCCFLKNY